MSEDIRKMIDKVKNFKQFVNENKKIDENLLGDLFKSKSTKLKELEKKYVGKNVSFQLKTTNSRGIEIPSNTIRLSYGDLKPISKDGILQRKISRISFTSLKEKIEIFFDSPTGEHILLGSGFGNVVYLDGMGEYSYMFNVIDLGDLKPIIEDVQTLIK